MITLNVKPGKYIVAVSGGVDSMVMLNLLVKQAKSLELVVAHFDHGIRHDSHLDRALVERTAKKYQLPFELSLGKLGAGASEEQARTARYKFLNLVKQKYSADAIITAHQMDDVIETALINILRGTGSRGLVAIGANNKVLRPMLGISKSEIVDYAVKHHIVWREDITNQDTKYLRNFIRQNVTTKLTKIQKQEIIKNVDKLAQIQKLKDTAIKSISSSLTKNQGIDRQLFACLPSNVGSELVANWLRQRGYMDFDRYNIEKTNLLIRTAKPDTVHDLGKNFHMRVGKLFVQIELKDEVK